MRENYVRSVDYRQLSKVVPSYLLNLKMRNAIVKILQPNMIFAFKVKNQTIH